MGGISGLIYSSLPVLVFVPVSTFFGLVPAIVAALGVAALILVWRLVRKESVQPAISGFIGVGICALIAYIVGESKGYFLLGIWMSLFWAVVFAASVADPPARRRLHLELGQRPRPRLARRAQGGAGVRHRDHHAGCWCSRRGSSCSATSTTPTRRAGWASARIAMGWPLTAVAALATYLAIRSAQRALHAHAPRSPTTAADGARRRRFRRRGRGAGRPSWPARASEPTDRSSRSPFWPRSWRSSTARWSTSRFPRSAANSAAGWRCSSG